MNRLTSNNYHEMDMVQLALNQAYVEGGWAWYVDSPEERLSVCDLIRSAAGPLGVDLPILSDEDLSDLLADWLQYGAQEPEGVLAILYRALWAMAELRERLSGYEETGLEPGEILRPTEMASVVCAMQELRQYKNTDLTPEQVRALIAPPPNAPLTLEELREMDGEPVWIHSSIFPEDCGWRVIEHAGVLGIDFTDGRYFSLTDYDKSWLAYRRKLEEG